MLLSPERTLVLFHRVEGKGTCREAGQEHCSFCCSTQGSFLQLRSGPFKIQILPSKVAVLVSTVESGSGNLIQVMRATDLGGISLRNQLKSIVHIV